MSIFSSLIAPFSRFSLAMHERVAVDLGSTRIRVWVVGKEGVIDEPCCVAFDSRLRLLAVGQDALDMRGRVGEGVRVVFPVRHGVLADQEAMHILLKAVLQKVFPSVAFLRPVVAVSVANRATQSQREVLVRVVADVGAHEVYVVDQGLAAAIGSGVPIADASGSFVLHAGGGVVESSIITLGSVVETRSLAEAGEAIDRVIVARIRTVHGLDIGFQQAEQLKIRLCSLAPDLAGDERQQVLVSGRDRESGVPREVFVQASELHELVHTHFVQVVDLMKEVFSRIPPELASDVLDKGVLCSGGLAQLHGLERFLTRELGVPAFLVDAPQRVVIQGLVQILENLELYKQSLAYQG